MIRKIIVDVVTVLDTLFSGVRVYKFERNKI